MKTCIIILFLSMLSLTSFSQQYYPLVEENKSWSVLTITQNGCMPPFDTTYYTVNYLILGDSNLNNTEYKKLYTSNEEIPVNWTLNGFIREDNVNRVWYKRIVDTNEVLLYDFSLQMGDSLQLGFDTTVYYKVDSISTEIVSDSLRKKYWISQNDYNWKETWIEGVGSDKGITGSAMASAVGGWTRILCMSEEGYLTYMNPNYQSCYLVTGVNDITISSFKIYPNPANNYLIIENLNKIDVESITISNLNGQKIKQFDNWSNQLDISTISSGMYILIISYKGGEVNKKLLIE